MAEQDIKSAGQKLITYIYAKDCNWASGIHMRYGQSTPLDLSLQKNQLVIDDILCHWCYVLYFPLQRLYLPMLLQSRSNALEEIIE